MCQKDIIPDAALGSGESEKSKKTATIIAGKTSLHAAEEEINALKLELMIIGKTIGFLSMEPGGEFNENLRHIRALEIGERLNRLGGIEVMREVGEEVAYNLRDIPGRGRELEAAWVGIGRWM